MTKFHKLDISVQCRQFSLQSNKNTADTCQPTKLAPVIFSFFWQFLPIVKYKEAKLSLMRSSQQTMPMNEEKMEGKIKYFDGLLFQEEDRSSPVAFTVDFGKTKGSGEDKSRKLER